MEGFDPELFSSGSSFDELRSLRSMRQKAMVALGAALAAHAAESEYVEPFRGGSLPGRAPNRNADMALGGSQIDLDYFARAGGTPRRSEVLFERRFRMPRAVYERVRSACLLEDTSYKSATLSERKAQPQTKS